MEVLHPRCAGLDVHKETVVACVRLARGRTITREVQTFGTTTRELVRLLERLQRERVIHVAMEATGVYWKPLWHILEGSLSKSCWTAASLRCRRRRTPESEVCGRRPSAPFAVPR